MKNPRTTVIECQDKVHESFEKLTALIHVANGEDFLEFDASILKNYLWVLRDLVLECAKDLDNMEQLLSSSESLQKPHLSLAANST